MGPTLNLSRDTLQVRRVCLRARGDPLRARFAIESALGRVDPTRTGLPPSAVLVVRRLEPPDRLRLHGPRPAVGYEAAIAASLRQRAAAARRPWLSECQGAEEAVWFRDEAELLACLLGDLACGHVVARWWWPCLLGTADRDQWLRIGLRRHGFALPAALALLADRALAVKALRGLPVPWLQEAIAVVERDHGLERGATARQAGAQHPGPERVMAVSAGGRGPAVPPLGMRDAEHVPPLPAAREAERLRQQLLDLSRRLARVGETSRHRRLRAPPTAPGARTGSWRVLGDGVTKSGRSSQPTGRASPLEVPVGTQVAEQPPQIALAKPSAATPHPPPPRLQAPQATETPVGTAVKEKADELRRSILGRAPAMVRATSSSPPSAAREDAGIVGPREAAPPAAGDKASSRQLPHEAPDENGAETRFGGLFYLLNAMLELRWYGDFTQPRAPRLALSPWDVLALTGSAWFGVGIKADPIWDLLAFLAGREAGSEPGTGLVRRLPRNRRLRELTGRWLRPRLVTLDTRLGAALPGHPPPQLHALMCLHEAMIVVSPVRVDVRLDLAKLPLPIRIAGLDRDPGWIPAAGRIVAFHFT